MTEEGVVDAGCMVGVGGEGVGSEVVGGVVQLRLGGAPAVLEAKETFVLLACATQVQCAAAGALAGEEALPHDKVVGARGLVTLVGGAVLEDSGRSEMGRPLLGWSIASR